MRSTECHSRPYLSNLNKESVGVLCGKDIDCRQNF